MPVEATEAEAGGLAFLLGVSLVLWSCFFFFLGGIFLLYSEMCLFLMFFFFFVFVCFFLLVALFVWFDRFGVVFLFLPLLSIVFM